MILAVTSVLSFMSYDEDDEFDVPRCVRRRLGGSSAASSFDAEGHFAMESARNTTGASSSEPEWASVARRMKQRISRPMDMQDGRGRYERSAEKGKDTGYAQHAYEHLQEAETFGLGRPCLANCKFGRKCGMYCRRQSNP